MRVLIVEDHAGTIESMQALLEMAGDTVDSAANGLAALTRLAIHRPDVILLDWYMPGMDGGDLLKTLANDERLRMIPVVVLTAGEPSELPAFSGVKVLQKPVEPKTLLPILREMAQHQPESIMESAKHLTFERINEHVEAHAVEVPHQSPHALPRDPVAMLASLCGPYKAVRPILQTLTTIPWLPSRWQQAVTVFLKVLDSVCP